MAETDPKTVQDLTSVSLDGAFLSGAVPRAGDTAGLDPWPPDTSGLPTQVTNSPPEVRNTTFTS